MLMKGRFQDPINQKTFDSWIVITDKPLKFMVSCRFYELKTNDIKIKVTFGIIKLINTC